MPVQPVLYEAMYILDSTLDEAGVETAVKTLEDFVTSNGGEVIATREFGKRRLAFEIEGHTSGTYMIFYFKSFGPLVADLQREMRIMDSVVRAIVCVANPKALFDPKPEVTEEPAAEEDVEEAAAEVEAEIAGQLGAEGEAAPEAAEEAPAEEAVAEETPAAEEVAAEEAPAEEVAAEAVPTEEAPVAEEVVAEAVEEPAAAEEAAPAPEEEA
ncbi:MAG: 30S ribosomal protein S6 [Armatimonadota bacterium]